MKRTAVIDLILRISKRDKAFDTLEDTFRGVTRNELSSSLLECGIIPELLEHDSSEEKLWAKYCDILLAHAWNFLNISSEVLRARGDSADVFGKTPKYTIVGDAKAFRLSRTAKNHKDFKVNTLDDWRKADTYACLVSPLYQYPNRSSQIYQQAIERNVTLLSYVHLKFLIENHQGQDLSSLWCVAKNMQKTKSAELYWEAIDATICKTLAVSPDALKKCKVEEVEKTKEIGKEAIGFWEAKIEVYKKLPQREAVKRLIKAEKIEAKVRTIRRAIDKL